MADIKLLEIRMVELENRVALLEGRDPNDGQIPEPDLGGPTVDGKIYTLVLMDKETGEVLFVHRFDNRRALNKAIADNEGDYKISFRVSSPGASSDDEAV